MHKYPEKFILFAGSDDEQTIELARQYLIGHKLTPDDAKIVRRGGAILVEAKREVTLG